MSTGRTNSVDRGLDTGTILFVLLLAILVSLQTGFYGPGGAGCCCRGVGHSTHIFHWKSTLLSFGLPIILHLLL